MRKALVTTILLLLLLPLAAAAQDPINRGHNPGGTVDSLIFGLELAILGMAIVFTGLFAVYFFMVLLRRTIARISRRRAAQGAAAPEPRPEITAEVIHAIALALYMDLRTFDDDDAEEITIRKITRPFSPWMDSGKTAMIARSRWELMK